MTNASFPFSTRLDLALHRAARWHRDGVRKGCDSPYIVHPVAVGMILDRLHFPENVVIAGILHDTVEDTVATLGEIEADFGHDVATMVAALSEIKNDESGQKRPWIDRKKEHIGRLKAASVEARAVALADKYHNLMSIEQDLLAGRLVWSLFTAGREDVLWYYRTCIEAYGANDAALAELKRLCRQKLAVVEAFRGQETT